MREKPTNILGIHPGSRYIAFAIFSGLELKDSRLKVLSGRWSATKLKRALTLISGIIERHGIEMVVIKRLHPARTSPALKSLTLELLKLAERKRLLVRRYSIIELKDQFLKDVGSNKRNLANKMAERYPELATELQREKASRNPYHIRIFEAVALGSLGAQELANS